MQYKRYRVLDPTIAMFEENGRHVAHQVPVGTIIMVDGSFDGNRLMDVLWADKRVMMFTQDLRTRAEPAAEQLADD